MWPSAVQTLYELLDCNEYQHTENTARAHARAKIAHFPMRCIIRAWEAWSRRLSAFQVLMMHWVGKCAISTRAWVLTFIPWPVRTIKATMWKSCISTHLSSAWIVSWSWGKMQVRIKECEAFPVKTTVTSQLTDWVGFNVSQSSKGLQDWRVKPVLKTSYQNFYSWSRFWCGLFRKVWMNFVECPA